MSDVNDFLGDHPVPQPPVKVVRDPVGEAFREETTTRAAGTPSGGRSSGLRLEVAQPPCKAGSCRHPAGTLCGSVTYEPDPSLDEVAVGWTAQHIPLRRDPVSYHCILCWELSEHPALHDCEVLALLSA